MDEFEVKKIHPNTLLEALNRFPGMSMKTVTRSGDYIGPQYVLVWDALIEDPRFTCLDFWSTRLNECVERATEIARTQGSAVSAWIGIQLSNYPKKIIKAWTNNPHFDNTTENVPLPNVYPEFTIVGDIQT
jgi:hypothetical protein